MRRIAVLARLRLLPEEEEKLVVQLGKVLDYIDQLDQFSASEEPLAVADAGEAQDEVGASLAQQDFLANAPAALESFLVVPQVKGSDG